MAVNNSSGVPETARYLGLNRIISLSKQPEGMNELIVTSLGSHYRVLPEGIKDGYARVQLKDKQFKDIQFTVYFGESQIMILRERENLAQIRWKEGDSRVMLEAPEVFLGHTQMREELRLEYMLVNIALDYFINVKGHQLDELVFRGVSGLAEIIMLNHFGFRSVLSRSQLSKVVRKKNIVVEVELGGPALDEPYLRLETRKGSYKLFFVYPDDTPKRSLAFYYSLAAAFKYNRPYSKLKLLLALQNECFHVSGDYVVNRINQGWLQRYVGRGQLNRASSSPVYSSNKTPLIINPAGELIYGRVEELNEDHLDLFRDWDNHFWKSFGKLKHFDIDHVEVLLRFQSGTYKTFVVVTEIPDFAYILNSRLQRDIKLVSGNRQIQGALNLTISQKYVGINLLETAPWNQFSGNKFFSLPASGLYRFVYSNYIEDYNKYLILRASISPEAMSLYERIFNKRNFKSKRPINDFTGKFDIVIDKEVVAAFAASFDKKYPLSSALTASSPLDRVGFKLDTYIRPMFICAKSSSPLFFGALMKTFSKSTKQSFSTNGFVFRQWSRKPEVLAEGIFGELKSVNNITQEKIEEINSKLNIVRKRILTEQFFREEDFSNLEVEILLNSYRSATFKGSRSSRQKDQIQYDLRSFKNIDFLYLETKHELFHRKIKTLYPSVDPALAELFILLFINIKGVINLKNKEYRRSQRIISDYEYLANPKTGLFKFYEAIVNNPKVNNAFEFLESLSVMVARETAYFPAMRSRMLTLAFNKDGALDPLKIETVKILVNLVKQSLIEEKNIAGKKEELASLTDFRNRKNVLPALIPFMAYAGNIRYKIEDNNIFLEVRFRDRDGLVKYAYIYLGQTDDLSGTLSKGGRLFNWTYRKWQQKKPGIFYYQNPGIEKEREAYGWQRLIRLPITRMIKEIGGYNVKTGRKPIEPTLNRLFRALFNKLGLEESLLSKKTWLSLQRMIGRGKAPAVFYVIRSKYLNYYLDMLSILNCC